MSQVVTGAGHELDTFFFPQSVAIVGASPDATKIRGLLLSLLRRNGYPGRLYPVNPSYAEIDGIPCHPSITAIGEPVDLALVAIPAGDVLVALEGCAAAGVRHAVIISSGFAEEGGAAVDAQARIAELARRTGMRISGPNAEGFHNEPGRVSATFSPAVDTKPGETRITATSRRIGIVAQSGGIGFALYNRGRAAGLAFSYVISTGNESDLTASNFFDYMVQDAATDVVMLFLESVRDPANFVAAAERAAASGKPVIVIKVGQSGAGERAAASHTASMTGWNAAYEAVFARYGFIQASDPDEAVAIAAALTTGPLPQGNRAAILTVSGGAGAWTADTLARNGLDVPELSGSLQDRIRAVIPSYGSPRNPVDITAQAVHTGGLQTTLELLNDSDEVDLVVIVTSLSNENRIPFSVEALKRVVDARRKLILVHTYTLPSELARVRFAEAGLAVLPNLSAMGVAARRAVERAAFVPPAARDGAGVEARPRLPLPAGAATLSEHETKELLRGAGIAIPNERLVASLDELDRALDEVGFPLAMKIQSPDIPHKSEVGGVRLGIADAAAAREAFAAMMQQVRERRQGAHIQGVLLSPMAAKGVEMIVGTIRDAVFGPMVMLGLGGVTTELFKDVVYRPAPVSEAEAEAMVRALKAAPLLSGFRGSASADIPALAALVSRISHVAAVMAEDVAELELNPVIVHPHGQGLTIADALLVPGPR